MYKVFNKATALLSALLLCASAVSCSSKKVSNSNTDGSDSNIAGEGPADNVSLAEEDMPYGSTMTELRSSNDSHITIISDFDPRYFEKTDNNEYPEIYLIHDYLKALQDGDTETVEKLFYKPYLESTVKDRNYSSIEEYVEKYRENLMNKTQSEFEFINMSVDTCLNENESTDLTEFDNVDSNLDVITGEKISEKIESRKLVYVDAQLSGESGITLDLNSIFGSDLSLYIYKIDGQYYLL